MVGAMAGPPDPQDAARRIRAALGYSKTEQRKVYEALSVERTTFARMIGTKGAQRSGITWEQLQIVAEQCRVPWAWFTADLSRLEEIASPDAPVFPVRVDGAPPIGGETGRRVEGRPTKPEDRRGPDSDQDTDDLEGGLG